MEQRTPLEISELLCCSICMEGFDSNYRQPKLLPCHHTFCKICLGNLFSSTGQCLCPTCRKQIILQSPPPHGIARLQTNFYVTQMREYLNHDAKTKGCQKHDNADLNYFCSVCEVLICAMCTQTDHKSTTGHETQDLEAAKQEQIRQLDVQISSAQLMIMEYQSKRRQCETELFNLSTVKNKAVQDVNDVFDKYIELVNLRRQNLTEQVLMEFSQRKTDLQCDIEAMKVVDASLNGLIGQVKDSISNGNISDLLAYKAKLSDKNKELQQDRHLLQKDIGENFIKFENGDLALEFMDILERLGSITVRGHLPCKVMVTKTPAVAGLFTSFTVMVMDARGEELDNYPLSIEITDVCDDIIPSIIKNQSNGRYHVTFRPELSGLHRIQVKFLDQVITGGTFALDVNSNDPVSVLGGNDNHIEMDFPRSVAVDKKNNLYVVDTGNNRILKFNKADQYLSEFSISSASDVYSSCGLAVDDVHGTLICPEVCVRDADLLEASVILVYTFDGELLQRYNYQDIMSQALSVAVDSSCHMVIADYELNTVFVFDTNGRLLHKFGESGSEPGQFSNPTFLCTGTNNNIFVSDGNNHRIQVFSNTGQFLYQFGKHGTGKGEFNMPFGIAADFHGNLLVVDGGNKRVQVFKQSGEFLSCVESLGDRMNAPRGIAVTSDGYALVADRDNHCVKKYRYLHCTSL